MEKKDGEMYGTTLSPMGRFGTKLNGFEVVPHVIAKLAMDSDDLKVMLWPRGEHFAIYPNPT